MLAAPGGDTVPVVGAVEVGDGAVVGEVDVRDGAGADEEVDEADVDVVELEDVDHVPDGPEAVGADDDGDVDVLDAVDPGWWTCRCHPGASSTATKFQRSKPAAVVPTRTDVARDGGLTRCTHMALFSEVLVSWRSD